MWLIKMRCLKLHLKKTHRWVREKKESLQKNQLGFKVCNHLQSYTLFPPLMTPLVWAVQCTCRSFTANPVEFPSILKNLSPSLLSSLDKDTLEQACRYHQGLQVFQTLPLRCKTVLLKSSRLLSTSNAGIQFGKVACELDTLFVFPQPLQHSLVRDHVWKTNSPT